MPDPWQQDRKLNRDELVTYRYSVVLVEAQSGVALQLATTLVLIFVATESMWYF